MPVLYHTGQLLGVADDGANFSECESRSLMFERLADPSLKEGRRTTFFRSAAAKRVYREKSDQWLSFLLNDLKLEPGDLLYAQLQSRMMVNIAGGVMENAGLCLDRMSGLPYIPGSAVRGCARRMAIQLLIEARKAIKAREADQQTEALARFLADVALVFGWGQDDWKPECHIKSDFVYAIGSALWPKVGPAAGRLLLPIEPKQPNDFGHFAGRVSFLPAYPSRLADNNLELDVVTCHHRLYYDEPSEPKAVPKLGKRWQQWKRDHDAWEKQWGSAPDTEEPNPVTFIAVAAGATFAFPTLALRGERGSLSQPGAKLHIIAREWLLQGLETFGLGAKTAAGYGWFKMIPPAEHPLISKWRGRAITDNFRVLLPELAAIEGAQELRRIFDAIIPENERRSLRKSNRYWQSFVSRPDGQKILQRLGITLR